MAASKQVSGLRQASDHAPGNPKRGVQPGEQLTLPGCAPDGERTFGVGARWELATQLFDDDILFLEWRAESASVKAEDGIDTFVFRDGLIRVQTVR